MQESENDAKPAAGRDDNNAAPVPRTRDEALEAALRTHDEALEAARRPRDEALEAARRPRDEALSAPGAMRLPALLAYSSAVTAACRAYDETVAAVCHTRDAGDAAPPANAVQVGGSHYKGLDPQPWDVILAWNLGFLEGCALKYLARWRAKGGIEDLHKARHYLDKLVEQQLPKADKGAGK